MSYAPEPGRFRRAAGDPVLSGNALAVGSMVMWAAGFPAAELLLDTWPPVALIVARLAMALLVLVPLWILSDGLRTVRQANWGRALLVGGIGFGLGTYLLLVAQWLTDPVTTALVAACTPVSATVVEILYRQRRLTRAFFGGLAATVAGGAIATGGMVAPEFGWGLLCAIASSFLFSWASLAAVRDFPDLTPIGRSTITFVGAFAMVNLLYVLHAFTGSDVVPSAPITGDQIGLLAIYAVAGMALSQILFIASVGRLGVAVSAFHINFAPFYVMLILLALGAAWSWNHAIGAAVVALGVVIAQRRSA